MVTLASLLWPCELSIDCESQLSFYLNTALDLSSSSPGLCIAYMLPGTSSRLAFAPVGTTQDERLGCIPIYKAL